MDARHRAVSLGVLAGVSDALVRVFVGAPAPFASATGVERVMLVALSATSLGLVASVGIPLYGAWQTGPGTETPTRLASMLGVAAGATTAATTLLVTASYVGAPFPEALRLRLVGPYLVTALATAVSAGVAALAGYLLAARDQSLAGGPERNA